ncbi:MAG: TPM domain-containing protein [Luteolibacter sp.]
MRCPYCQLPLPAADSEECPSCRLSFPRTCSLEGALPRLSPKIADTAKLLTTSDLSKLKDRIQEIEYRFPEIHLQLVLHRFPAEHPFSLHVFWLFNAAAFAGDKQRGNENRAILIALDPVRRESAIMPGYGLEAFLNEETIGHVLDLAAPAWSRGQWAKGFLQVLNGLDAQLERIGISATSDALSTGDY